jgi:hypothetical protein
MVSRPGRWRWCAGEFAGDIVMAWPRPAAVDEPPTCGSTTVTRLRDVTSGSTGRQGVVVRASATGCAGQHEYGMTPDESVVQRRRAPSTSVWERSGRSSWAPARHRPARRHRQPATWWAVQRHEITTVLHPDDAGMFVGEPASSAQSGGHGQRQALSWTCRSVAAQTRTSSLWPRADKASVEVGAWHCRPEWTAPVCAIGIAVASRAPRAR